MIHERYFDNAATTPVDRRVLDAMLPYLADLHGNAHSLHSWGRQAMDAVDVAREQVADLIGAEDPAQIVFTSGATESNNWFLRAFPNATVSTHEHSSIREPAERRGHTAMGTAPTEPCEALSWIHVQNETGQIWDLAPMRAQAKVFHSDLTQAAGKLRVDLSVLDYASFSSHKLYGPMGIGAFYQKDYTPEPLICGGGQEDGARAGTLNVPGIVGFGMACRIASEELEADLQHSITLRQVLLEELAPLSDWEINGEGPFSPHILNISFAGVLSESVVVDLDLQGFAVSGGAACSAKSVKPSAVLLALGYPIPRIRSAIRISFGRANTVESTIELAGALKRCVDKLRTMGS